MIKDLVAARYAAGMLIWQGTEEKEVLEAFLHEIGHVVTLGLQGPWVPAFPVRSARVLRNFSSRESDWDEFKAVATSLHTLHYLGVPIPDVKAQVGLSLGDSSCYYETDEGVRHTMKLIPTKAAVRRHRRSLKVIREMWAGLGIED
jgi:hypothetical protein